MVLRKIKANPEKYGPKKTVFRDFLLLKDRPNKINEVLLFYNL